MEQKLDCCSGGYPPLVRIQRSGWEFTLGYGTEATFHLLHSGKRVRFPGGVNILICLHVEASWGSISIHPHTVKPFNVSSDSPAVSQKSKSKIIPPTVCLSKLG